MKKNELKKLIEKMSELLLNALPDSLKKNKTKAEKTTARHLKHLLKKLNSQSLKEAGKAEKSKKKTAAASGKSVTKKRKA